MNISEFKNYATANAGRLRQICHALKILFISMIYVDVYTNFLCVLTPLHQKFYYIISRFEISRYDSYAVVYKINI